MDKSIMNDQYRNKIITINTIENENNSYKNKYNSSNLFLKNSYSYFDTFDGTAEQSLRK